MPGGDAGLVKTGDSIARDEQAVKRGIRVRRFFTKPGTHPLDEVEWELRTAAIQNEKGQMVFEQRNVEVPKDWSQTATNIVASKYFHGKLGTAGARVERAATDQPRGRHHRPVGHRGRLLPQRRRRRSVPRRTAPPAGPSESCVQFPGLVQLRLVAQVPPQCGRRSVLLGPRHGRHQEAETEAYRHPQCSACFINSVQDNLDSILNLAKTEGMLFKWGSGTGTNLSPLRSSMEPLSGGGRASGPLSFMRGYDAFAGVIKSGGKTRRAAKMVILNIDHPDVVEFIECKAKEERKAWALVEAGYDARSAARLIAPSSSRMPTTASGSRTSS